MELTGVVTLERSLMPDKKYIVLSDDRASTLCPPVTLA